MKKGIFVIIFFTILNIANGQVKNAIKFNIFSPIVRTGSFFYERTLTESSSLNFGFLFTKIGVGDTDFSGWALTPEYRFYLSETAAPHGFYVAPYLRYQQFSLTHENSYDAAYSKADMTGYGGGLLVGRQWVFKQRVTFDLFIGPSYTSADLKVKSGDEEDFETGSWDGFGVRAGVTLGIAF